MVWRRGKEEGGQGGLLLEILSEIRKYANGMERRGGGPEHRRRTYAGPREDVVERHGHAPRWHDLEGGVDLGGRRPVLPYRQLVQRLYLRAA